MPIINRFSRNWNINTEAKSNACYSGRTVSNYFFTFPIFLTIGGVDKRGKFVKDSLEIHELTTTQGTTASFALYGALADKPTLGQEVFIAYSTQANVLFKGQIINIVSRRVGRGKSGSTTKFFYDVTCNNYISLLSRLLVRKSYTATYVDAVVRDIIANFAPGFTVRTIPPIAGFDVALDYWYFDNEPVADALKKLCDAAYLYWTVDHNKVISVQKKLATQANLSLNDGDPNWDELEIEEDYSQVRNRVYIRGANALSFNDLGVGPQVDTFTSNGQLSQVFNLSYEPAAANSVLSPPYFGLQISDGTTIYQPGIENVDSETGLKFMLNVKNKAVRYAKGSTAIPNATNLTFTYQYYLPTLAVVENQTAQSNAYSREGNDNSGGSNRSIHEAFIQEQSLENFVAAQQRGKAELSQFCYPVIRGSFKTVRYNFDLAEWISINLSDRPSYTVFIYEKVSRMKAAQRFEYEIRFTDTQRDLFIDLMQIWYKRTNKREIQKQDAEGVESPPLLDNF